MDLAPSRRARLVTLLALFAGCAPLDNPYRPYPEPSYDEFVAMVQPVVTGSCAFLGCHGNHDRTLALYAPGYLRAAPATPGAPLDDTRLTTAELAWNYDALRLRLFGESSAEDSYLLQKCLDPAQGGIVHAAGYVVFATTADPGYLALRDWIAGGL